MNSVGRRPGGAAILGALLTGLGAVAAASDTPAETVRWNGELSFRLERVEPHGGRAFRTPSFRALAGGLWTPDEQWSLTAGLATRGPTPASLDRRLDEGRADPRLGLRLAAARWMPAGELRCSLTLGRMEPPWIAVSDLLWDADLTPDGVAFRGDTAPGEWAGLTRGGAFVVRAGDGADAPRLHALQAALLHRTGKQTHQLAGVSGFLADPAAPWPPAAGGASSPEEDLVTGEVFGEIGIDLYYPLVLFGQYARQAEAEGWLTGATLGRARAIHSLELSYTYRRIERGLFPEAWVSSDLGGGGTAQCGHVVTLTYQLARDWQLALGWMDSRPLEGREAPPERRLRCEARWRF